jgi:hypothetical protein
MFQRNLLAEPTSRNMDIKIRKYFEAKVFKAEEWVQHFREPSSLLLKRNLWIELQQFSQVLLPAFKFCFETFPACEFELRFFPARDFELWFFQLANLNRDF